MTDLPNPVVTVPVSSLRPGDTVVLDGVPKTTDRHAIKHCPFMGTSLWGDCRGPHRTVEVMLFPVWVKGVLQGHARLTQLIREEIVK